MKTSKQINSVIGAVIIAAALMLTSSCQKENSTDPATIDQKVAERRNSPIIPPGPKVSYAMFSKNWWQWNMELPLPCHPSINDTCFDVSEGQSGPVWFLAAPIDTLVRNCTIPAGKGLFVGLLNAEASSLEGLGTTDSEQTANAKFLADHILNLFASIDGISVMNINSFRAVSPQFHFTAPTPWLFGATGGPGTSVGDGYYMLLKPLPTGTHTLHYGGSFHFSIAEGDPFDYDASMDMTYNLMVQ